MDAIGCPSYLLAGIAEFRDILWALASTIIFYKTFGGWKGAFARVFLLF
jgi:hypothetical protein